MGITGFIRDVEGVWHNLNNVDCIYMEKHVNGKYAIYVLKSKMRYRVSPEYDSETEAQQRLDEGMCIHVFQI